MNTLAKVIRDDSAAAFTAFRPNELGGGGGASAGVQAFQFPSAEFAASTVAHHAAGTHSFAYAPVQELPVIDAYVETVGNDAEEEFAPVVDDSSAIENAVREKTMQEMRASIEADVNAQVGNLRQNLAATIDQIAKLGDELSAKLETEAVELALEIAKKIVAHEVSIDHEAVMSVTKTALSKLHSRTLATVHLNFDDLAYIQSHRDKLNFHGSLEFVEDDSISPGGCLIHTDAGDIDGRIESQFDEIAHGLLGPLAGITE